MFNKKIKYNLLKYKYYVNKIWIVNLFLLYILKQIC